MSYYNRYRNKRRADGSSGSGGGAPQGETVFDLGKNKRVTVRQFRNINLIDIREYYMDAATGEMKPGKKGISLTEDVYDELLRHRLNIDESLRRLGSKRARTKTVRVLSDTEDEKENEEACAEGAVPDKPKRQQVAPPTLLPHEENLKQARREATATLVIPGAQPAAPAAPAPSAAPAPPSAPSAPSAPAAPSAASSDEEFAQSLEAEMNHAEDESEEE